MIDPTLWRIDEIWRAPAAPETLAASVLDAVAARRRRGRIRSVAVAVAAAAIAAAVLLWAWPEPPAGAVEIAFDPGAEITWVTRGDRVEVDHRAGQASYRTNRPIDVRTPAGAIRAESALFTLEVKPMKREIASALGGAAVAVAAVVVYKGTVTAEIDRGEVSVTAGERATLEAGDAAAEGGAISPAPPSATREQLLARDRMLVQRVSTLTGRITELETKLGAAGGDKAGDKAAGDVPDPDKFFDLSEAELASLADRCEIRYDIPGYAMTSDTAALAERINKVDGLEDNERAALRDAVTVGDPALLAELRAIYIEVTGDRAGADTLSPRNLQHEVFSKSPGADVAEALRLISAESAGLAEPPADLSSRPPVERLLRALSGSGVQLEAAIATRLGPDRARELREKGVVWARRRQSGCPD